MPREEAQSADATLLERLRAPRIAAPRRAVCPGYGVHLETVTQFRFVAHAVSTPRQA